jgi:hypothetical protein
MEEFYTNTRRTGGAFNWNREILAPAPVATCSRRDRAAPDFEYYNIAGSS